MVEVDVKFNIISNRGNILKYMRRSSRLICWPYFLLSSKVQEPIVNYYKKVTLYLKLRYFYRIMLWKVFGYFKCFDKKWIICQNIPHGCRDKPGKKFSNFAITLLSAINCQRAYMKIVKTKFRMRCRRLPIYDGAEHFKSILRWSRLRRRVYARAEVKSIYNYCYLHNLNHIWINIIKYDGYNYSDFVTAMNVVPNFKSIFFFQNIFRLWFGALGWIG